MNIKDLTGCISEISKYSLNDEKQSIEEYIGIVGDILNNPRFSEMKAYHHHKTITCHFHSVYVSYLTFRLSSALGCSTEEATRAALLHDFYLYDWHITKHDTLHAWYHPRMAVLNAEEYVGALSDKQKSMIKRHMWPLYLLPPDSKEGMILTLVDKYCTNMDMFKQSYKFLPIYFEIDKERLKYENC